MLNPGDYSLCDLQLTAALSNVVQTPIQNLEGMIAANILFKFTWTSGGTTARAYVQITLDDGQTWIDIACRSWTTASETKIINLSGLTPVAPFTPSDGAMADNTLQDGVFGSAMRVKLLTTGTYVNTNISVKLSAR
jgi:hypothetical protein